MKKFPVNRSCFILQEEKFRKNLALIKAFADKTSVEVILALKAFSFWPSFPMVREYVPGATASSLHEALLVHTHMQVKPHVYMPVYIPQEFEQLSTIAHSLTFNSLSELERYRNQWKRKDLNIGLRVNPLYSDVKIDLYNPSSETGRLGTPYTQLPKDFPDGLKGIHVHTLCESPAKSTLELLNQLDQKLASYLSQLQWLNLGGGHLLTKEDYDLDLLISGFEAFKTKYPKLHITMEPGSAFAWNAGVLVAHVLDIVDHGGQKTAMIDASFTCHMPDTLEMPYQPEVLGAKQTQDITGKCTYALGGSSCLAGDFVGNYTFDRPLEIGQQLIFKDMAHYTTVKTTTFNGVRHPDLAIQRLNGDLEILKQFDFQSYESKLG